MCWARHISCIVPDTVDRLGDLALCVKLATAMTIWGHNYETSYWNKYMLITSKVSRNSRTSEAFSCQLKDYLWVWGNEIALNFVVNDFVITDTSPTYTINSGHYFLRSTRSHSDSKEHCALSWPDS